MAYNYEYPYTDTGSYNDDWLLSTVKQLGIDFTQLRKYVMDYFAGLDISAELQTIIQHMADSGQLAQLFGGWISVKMFGAKGNGVADDTEAFRRAFSTIGRGWLYIPHGTYLIEGDLSALNIYTNMFGDGRDTIINISYSWNFIANIEIRNMQLQKLNPADNNPLIVMNTGSNDSVIENVFFAYTPSTVLRIRNISMDIKHCAFTNTATITQYSTISIDTECQEIEISDCVFNECYGDAIFIAGASRVRISETYFINIGTHAPYANGEGYCAIRTLTTTFAYDVEIVDCTINNCSSYGIICRISGGGIFHNTVQNCGRNGIECYAFFIKIIGNTLINNGRNSGQQYLKSGIAILDGNSFLLSNNISQNTTTEVYQTNGYIIGINSAAFEFVAIGNIGTMLFPNAPTGRSLYLQLNID